VRHHELSPKSKAQSPKSEDAFAHLARIEVGPTELPKFLENDTSAKAAEALKQIGYAHVTLDLQGYRRGSLNEVSASRATNHALRETKM
jgi:PP-loop superfamily ATP-utilizing enzyme